MTNIKKRIFHGPATVGGIGWHLAKWQREQGNVSDCIVYDDNGFRQLFDLNLKASGYQRIRRFFLRVSFFVFCLFRFDIFHFYSAVTFLPFNLDLPILKILGKRIVMTYCGSDIRLIYVVKKRNAYPDLFEIGKNNLKYDTRKKLMMRWHNLWIDRFTAIRELEDYALQIIPHKKLANEYWINNIGFDSRGITNQINLVCNDIPIIVHAPSKKDIKGTEYVRKAIKSLRLRGVRFDYQELHGVSNSRVQEIIRDCDIVVDQFILGEIGTFAFEGMGFGKPVVAYLPKEIVDRCIPGCPVFNATIEDLADRLEKLINNPDLRLELGQKGMDFVEKHLDYEQIQRGVLEIYGSLK